MSSSPKAIISPSVLASDFGKLAAECTRMIKDGADWLHMGKCHGRVKQKTAGWMNLQLMTVPRHFVPNITIGAPVLKSVAESVTGAYMDCHMMVSDPARWVKDVAEAGGKSYTFHIEATGQDGAIPVIDLIHSHGLKCGVAISPQTPSSAITDEIGSKADMLLVMTVHPGRGGQKFMEECVPKVAELRARFPTKDIEVDGGVGPKTVQVCADAGSNVIVAGTAVFGAPQPKEVIAQLRKAVEDGMTKWPQSSAKI